MVDLPPGFPSNPLANLTGNDRANQVIAESNGTPLPNITDSDQLSNLLEISISGIPFPVISFVENSSQDMAVHKYPNLDSARVEQTGRNPSVFAMRGVFTNNIYPGKNESWKAGTLYPDVFEKVLNELYDSTTKKKFFHPFLGERNVVPMHWSYEYAGKSTRDGVLLEIALIESISSDNIADTIEIHNSMSDMQKTANALDTELSKTIIAPMNPPNMSLTQLFSRIAGVIRNVVNYPKQAIGAVNAQIIQINSSIQGAGAAIANSPGQLKDQGQAIVNQNKGLILHGPVSNAHFYDQSSTAPRFSIHGPSLERVYNTANTMNSNASNSAVQLIDNTIAFVEAMVSYYQRLNRVETANAVFLLYQMLGQLFVNRAKAFGNSRNYKIRTYTTPGRTSLAAVGRVVNNTIEQLTQLNPKLAKAFTLPEETRVLYYQA